MRIHVDTDLRVPVRDGTRLAADVYRPGSGGPAPALLLRTPYGRELALVSPYLEGLRLARAGFAVVVQDVRGRGGSGGDFTPFQHDAADGADTIAWIRRQSWCSGRIGLIGPSYSGVSQWLTAAEQPAGLEAIAPIMAPAAIDDGWVRRGRVFERGFNVWWGLNLGLGAAGHTSASDGAAPTANRDAILDALDRIDGIYRLDDAADDPVVRAAAPFLATWQQPGPLPVPAVDLGRVAAAPLIVSGWYDVFLRGALASYERIRREGASPAARDPRLIVGPWSHNVGGGVFDDRDFGVRSSLAQAGVPKEIESWLRRTLVAEPSSAAGRASPGPDERAGVRLFVMGADAWRDFGSWPPPARRVPLFLGSDGDARTRFGDGRLRPEPQAEARPDAFDVDPADPLPTTGGAVLLAGPFVAARAGPRNRRAVEERPDVLCYTSEALTEDAELIGPVAAVLWVHSTLGSMDFTAALVDVAPDGRAEIVADGIERIEVPDSGAPTPTPVECRIDLGATAIRLRAGHRIRLEVSSTDFPRFALPGGLTGSGAVARNLIFHDDAWRSYLELPLTSGAL
jgi:putative CocE/NonD family hydrolase